MLRCCGGFLTLFPLSLFLCPALSGIVPLVCLERFGAHFFYKCMNKAFNVSNRNWMFADGMKFKSRAIPFYSLIHNWKFHGMRYSRVWSRSNDVTSRFPWAFNRSLITQNGNSNQFRSFCLNQSWKSPTNIFWMSAKCLGLKHYL